MKIIPIDEAINKIKAVNSRKDSNFSIIARTDARSVLGFMLPSIVQTFSMLVQM